MNLTKKIMTLFIAVSLFAWAGCGASNTVKGGAIGTGAGALIGGIIGHAAGSTTTGAIIGGVVGGTAGALIGHNMDKQAEELKKIEDAKVERVGEGINITFDSGILFAVNSASLQPKAKESVQKLADVLKKYPDTNVIIEGNTDNTGSEALNQKLSEKRAKAVSDYVTTLGVSSSRLTTVGKGESNPVASNDTPEGRAKNRRVEIGIVANEKMKNDAATGKLN
ncbi:MAG: OmpA family protein [Ignavibacteria bacterium]|nr:OmpA family protein [Ignavibacteria bacterium]MCU7499718.1 OmpA family protein [Ignavibacteria bacterium]MCU7514128.1 OmpA family protein [Ignavibacteria bacterium]MCU7519887.1 OmpA family protein [Ignavibacteria bacterium]MCU7526026.1 OmpA family protein [Ignavibacteria bacterium]